MMAVFFFNAREKGFKFHAQPQNGAYSCLLYLGHARMTLTNAISQISSKSWSYNVTLTNVTQD